MTDEIYIVLDNVKYAQNLGPIFRLADGFGIKKIFLCKSSHEKLNFCQERILFKASRGTTQVIDWEFRNSCIEVLDELKAQNINIVGVETGEASELIHKTKITTPVALVFGSENEGISEEVIKLSDKLVKIPMEGVGKSLNVSTSVSIAVYEVFRQISD